MVLNSLRREQADKRIQTIEIRMSESQGERVIGEKQPLSAISVNCQSYGNGQVRTTALQVLRHTVVV